VYVRQKTVRRWNRHHPDARLRYRSKIALARMLLEELRHMLPRHWQVVVVFDSWYASGQLLRWSRRQGWHVVCWVKANRKVDGQAVRVMDRRQKGQRYTRVRVDRADGTHRTYWVRTWTGHLPKVGTVRVVSSRRDPRARCPKYAVTTNPAMAVHRILRWLDTRGRWSIEVEHTYMHTHLGMGDFRVRTPRAIRRWLVLVHLALTFVQWQQHATHAHRPSEVIDRLRSQVWAETLRWACTMVARTGRPDRVLAALGLHEFV